MKTMKKTWVNILFTTLLAVTILLATSMEAQAAAKPKLESNKETVFFTKKTTDIIALQNIQKGAKVTVKSSNPSVVKAKYYDWKKSTKSWSDGDDNRIKYGVELTVNKPGKTTITCSVTQGGNTYQLSCEYIVKKYQNPLASFKIGSTNCTSEFKKTDYSEGNKLLNDIKKNYAEKCFEVDQFGWKSFDSEKFSEMLKEKAIVKVVPKKGYKLLEIDLLSGYFSEASKDKKIKNGSKISYSELMKYESIYIEVQDKQGDIIGLEMWLPEEEFFW